MRGWPRKPNLSGQYFTRRGDCAAPGVSGPTLWRRGYLPGDIETLGVEGHGVGLVLYGAVDHAEVDVKPTGVGVEVQQDDWGGVGSDFGGCFGEIEAVHLGFEGLVWIEGLLGVVAGASWCEVHHKQRQCTSAPRDPSLVLQSSPYWDIESDTTPEIGETLRRTTSNPMRPNPNPSPPSFLGPILIARPPCSCLIVAFELEKKSIRGLGSNIASTYQAARVNTGCHQVSKMTLTVSGRADRTMPVWNYQIGWQTPNAVAKEADNTTSRAGEVQRLRQIQLSTMISPRFLRIRCTKNDSCRGAVPMACGSGSQILKSTKPCMHVIHVWHWEDVFPDFILGGGGQKGNESPKTDDVHTRLQVNSIAHENRLRQVPAAGDGEDSEIARADGDGGLRQQDDVAHGCYQAAGEGEEVAVAEEVAEEGGGERSDGCYDVHWDAHHLGADCRPAELVEDCGGEEGDGIACVYDAEVHYRTVLLGLLVSRFIRASPWSSFRRARSKARSSSFRNVADSGQSTMMNLDIAAITTVARPSMMKIQRQPSYPASPDMLLMA
ncbi:unnamed protein product [Aspergillus oryzae var. brunneus]|uniref:Unnamed protein product n=1 Tax=Aspergillus oryzae var. brunneus TaxID=332754 RepID=A0ABQ6KDV5_ASPOZ|nr:unnamed protein product [Aspergillus oryzae var. brunneus]